MTIPTEIREAIEREVTDLPGWDTPDDARPFFDAFERIAALALAHGQLREAQEWRSIETAPKDVDAVMLCAEGWGVHQGWWDDESQRWVASETKGLTGGWLPFTHWKPLPADPFLAAPSQDGTPPA